MTRKEAIEVIDYLLTYHRQTHVNWLEFFIKNPRKDIEYIHTAGDAKHQRNCIASYDKALRALDVLKAQK